MLTLPVEKGISHHILVVDDDAEICRLVGEYLGEYHLRVSSAFDGRSMRRELERNVIHLVVLDIKLPDENGMTIARELRQRQLAVGKVANAEDGGHKTSTAQFTARREERCCHDCSSGKRSVPATSL